MRIFVVGTLLLLFSLSGCYTVLRQPRPSEQEIAVAKIFAREFIADEDLLGVWRKKRILMDWGEEINEIQFDRKGRFSFYSNGTTMANPPFKGAYRIFSDTLIIYFDNKYYVEKYEYRITDDRLQVKSLQTNRHETYFITDLRSEYDTYRRFK